MSVDTVHSLVLEFARADQAGDPYAFSFAPQDYLLRTPGGGFENSRFPWDQQLLSDLAALRRPDGDPITRQRVGELLRRFLLPMGWAEHEASLLSAATAQQRVLMTIRSAAAELYSLPWELLTIKSTGQHVGELPGVLVRHEWPDTRSAAEAAPRVEGGRILFAWSAAAGAVPAAEHQQAIEHACLAGSHPFSAAQDVLANASCARLKKTLEEASHSSAPITVLHLLCHGSAIGGTFGLGLDSDTPGGTPVSVDAGRLRQLLSPYAPMLRLVVLCACDSGNSGAVGNQLGSVAQTLHRGGIAAVVASRYPLSIAGSVRLTGTLYSELLGGPHSLESALLLARQQLAEDAAQLDWASVMLYARSADGDDTRPVVLRPYRGLLSFQPEHRRFFFGRDVEIAEIVERLRSLRANGQPRLLAVDGASGSGKSSVVLAGAAVDLLALLGNGAVLVQRQPGGAPLGALTGLPTQQPVLLVIDQFEELFTHTPETPEGRQQRNEFTRSLWSLATDSSRDVSVVLTMRSDFIGRCGELLLQDGRRLDSILYQRGNRSSIAQLGRAQLRQIIERPAAVVGLELESGLTERMLADVEAEPGALPLLADTLDSLWRKRRGRTLTQEAYDSLGGIAGTLTGRAEQLCEALTADELFAARGLLLRLVAIGEEGGQRTRRRVALSAARPMDGQSFDKVLGRLVDARLLVRGQGSPGSGEVIEVAHEALLRRWRRLGEWLEQDQQWLRQQARLQGWAAEYTEHGTLLRGHQLGSALEMVQGHSKELSAPVQQLLAASEAERAREQELAALARDSQRVLTAEQIAFDPTRAAALLREVQSKDPTRVPGWLARVTNILHREVLTCAELVGHQDSVLLARWSQNRTQLATASADGTVRLWNPQDGTALTTLLLPSGKILDLAFSPPNGQLVVATVAADQSVRVWAVTADSVGSTPRRTIAHRSAVSLAVLSPDCHVIATAGQSGEIWVTPTQSSGEPVTLSPPGRPRNPGPKDEVTALCFSADGRYLVSATRDGNVRLWDLRSKDQPRLLCKPVKEDDAEEDEDTSAPVAVAFHPGGAYIAIGQEQGGIRVIRRDGARAPLVLAGHEYRVTSLAFSPDGRLLASSSNDGAAALWGFCVPTRQAWLWGHRGDVNHAAFSADGNRLVTAGTDSSARIRDLERVPLDTAIRLAPKEQPAAAFVRCFWRQEGDTAQDYRKLLRTAESSDGKRSAKADAVGTVVVSAQGRTVLTLPKDGGPVTALCFSPDASKLAVAKQDRVVRLWDLASGQVTQLSGHHHECYALCFSPDSQLLATGSMDFTVRLWRADASGSLLRVLIHDGVATLVLFSPSGQKLITAAESDGLWLWDLDGTRLTLFDASREEYCIAVRRDLGECITEDGNSETDSADEDERFQWPLDLDPASLVARLWRATPICFSVEERCQLLGENPQEAEQNYQRSLQRVRSAAATAPVKSAQKLPPAPSWDGPEEEDDDE